MPSSILSSFVLFDTKYDDELLDVDKDILVLNRKRLMYPGAGFELGDICKQVLRSIIINFYLYFSLLWLLYSWRQQQ